MRNLRAALVGLGGAVAMVTALAGWSGWSAVPAGAEVAGPGPAVVSASGSQTVAGFGASGAWWTNDLGHFAPSVRDEVARLLFSPSGLALSQYRYNIGGGGTGVRVPYKAPPTMLVRPGLYDWSADPGGLTFLALAARYGVHDLVGFVNSAPAVWTSDHLSCGGSLLPQAVGAYAGYLTAVVAHLHQADHITLSYVSPMNEPDFSQWRCRQEGMQVPLPERASLVQALGQDLAARAPFAHVIADESSQVASQLVPELPRWLGVPGTEKWVAAIAHHTYDYPDADELAGAGALAGRFHKPLWATEICCFNGARFGWGYDPTMSSGLWLANTVYDDLVHAHDAAFDWWLALSPNAGCPVGADPACAQRINSTGRNDGLVYYDPLWRTDHDERLSFTKRYWALGNFSRYVRPGAVVHLVSGLPNLVHAVAFRRGEQWVVVAVDNTPTGAPDTNLVLRFPDQGALRALAAVQTSATRDLGNVPLPRYVHGLMTTSLAAHSVTTLVFGPGRSGAGGAGRVPAAGARTPSTGGPAAGGAPPAAGGAGGRQPGPELVANGRSGPAAAAPGRPALLPSPSGAWDSRAWETLVGAALDQVLAY